MKGRILYFPKRSIVYSVFTAVFVGIFSKMKEFLRKTTHNACCISIIHFNFSPLPGLDGFVVCASALVFVECPGMSDDIVFLIPKLAAETLLLKLGISLVCCWFGLVWFSFVLFFQNFQSKHI